MRILLTGSTGFVGNAIAAHLRTKGHQVVGVHLRTRSTPANEELQDVLMDIGSFSAVEKLCTDTVPCDTVIHAAASLDMNLFADSVTHVNCSGVRNMLWLAKQWRSRKFVFLSSLPVIGVPRQLPVTEMHPTEPLTAYHASKLFGEQLVRLAEAQGVPGVTLRLTAPVGPCMPRGRLLPVLIARALSQAPLDLCGTGSRKQNYIDVRDVANVIELCLNRNVGGLFNVASNTCISNLELARKCISRCCSSSQVVFNGREDPEEGLTWDVSIDKAKQQLGFIPRFDIDDAISAVMADIERKRG